MGIGSGAVAAIGTVDTGCGGLALCFGCGSPGTPAGRVRGLFDVVLDRMSVSGCVLGPISACGKSSIGPETSIVADGFEREWFGKGNSKQRLTSGTNKASWSTTTDGGFPVSLEPGLNNYIFHSTPQQNAKGTSNSLYSGFLRNSPLWLETARRQRF